ncbi:MAG: cell division protein SepF [Negativicutes bacterium]|nr:cell division protein SepF [Negativicutes bacterium]
MKLIDAIMEFIGVKEPEPAARSPRREREDLAAPVFGESRRRSSPREYRPPTAKVMPVNHNTSVIMIEPAVFDDSQHVADYLKSFHTVVINFEYADRETARRMIDFVSGVTYALNGSIQKVSRNILLCTPHNVDVNSEIDESLAGEER